MLRKLLLLIRREKRSPVLRVTVGSQEGPGSEAYSEAFGARMNAGQNHPGVQLGNLGGQRYHSLKQRI